MVIESGSVNDMSITPRSPVRLPIGVVTLIARLSPRSADAESGDNRLLAV
jgi:hypothetical protein